MNLNKTKILLEDFPNLYRQSKLSPSETCMCWGFECGDGWFDLIYKLSKDIINISEDGVEAIQVKEKFGGLRFYWIENTLLTDEQLSEINKLVDAAEDESYKICEKCGSREDIKQTDGWITTLCKNCMGEKYEKKKDKCVMCGEDSTVTLFDVDDKIYELCWKCFDIKQKESNNVPMSKSMAKRISVQKSSKK